MVKAFAAKVGIANLAPHDLRRTGAKLCHAAGGELEQIQFLLGHVSAQTTERYFGLQAADSVRGQRLHWYRAEGLTAAGDLASGRVPDDPGGASPQLERAPQSRYLILMGPDNPIVKLCLQGMECESSGRLAEALGFFMSAWMQSNDDFERCIAAHYVARHQKEPVNALLWNQRSLDHANGIPDDRVREFYPSLYLNMGKAHEDLGNREAAKRFYQTAKKLLDSLPKGRYSAIVREAVERALLRTGN